MEYGIHENREYGYRSLKDMPGVHELWKGRDNARLDS